MQAPGRRAVETGFVSRNNPDETAKTWHELNASAGIDRRRTLTWNIVPWYIGEDTRIRPATEDDIRRALPYLRRLPKARYPRWSFSDAAMSFAT